MKICLLFSFQIRSNFGSFCYQITKMMIARSTFRSSSMIKRHRIGPRIANLCVWVLERFNRAGAFQEVSSLCKAFLIIYWSSSLILSAPEDSKWIAISCESVVSFAVSLRTDRTKMEACTFIRRHVRPHESVFLGDVSNHSRMTRAHFAKSIV